MAKLSRNIDLDQFEFPKPPAWRPQTRRSQGWRGAYFAALADHGLRFKSDTVRRAFNSAILGKRTIIRGTSQWNEAQKGAWLDRFQQHCAGGCPGGDQCPAYREALRMAAVLEREAVPV